MANAPDCDLQSAHKYFSAHCFNSAWQLIEKPRRSSSDDLEMVRLAQASLWHWTQRKDCTPKNLSIAHWQLSRVYALLKDADSSRMHARLSLEMGRDAGVFYAAYAYEAMARAEKIAGKSKRMNSMLAKSRNLALRMRNAEDRKRLERDLRSIEKI
jgi:hypothetical protein